MTSKTFFITGISSGIGFGAAEFFLKQGHTVIGTGRNEEAFKNLNAFPQFKGFILDLKDKNQIDQIKAQLAKSHISKIDVLINNAGVALAGPFADQPFAEVEETLQVNVLALMKVTQNLIPLMTQPGGRIINISSVAGQNGTPFLAVYCTSKHAVEGFSEALRREMIFLGIKVILIGPGSIKTPIWFKGFESLKVNYVNSKFARSFDRFIKIAQNEEANGLPVSAVVENLAHAAFAKNPQIRYAPIPGKFRNYYLPMIFPKSVVDRLMAKFLGLDRPNN